tara:strand:- start:4253 stop:4462 length:210 start_codon:yes stop_codon:yes gene_type:complete
MINQPGEGYSYPMQERDERKPVKKDTFEERIKKNKRPQYEAGVLDVRPYDERTKIFPIKRKAMAKRINK